MHSLLRSSTPLLPYEIAFFDFLVVFTPLCTSQSRASLTRCTLTCTLSSHPANTRLTIPIDSTCCWLRFSLFHHCTSFPLHSEYTQSSTSNTSSTNCCDAFILTLELPSLSISLTNLFDVYFNFSIESIPVIL